MHSRGFVYVATGAGYVQEAVRSAKTLKRAMPKEKVCLVTDQLVSEPCFDVVVGARQPVHGPIDKLLALDSPFDLNVFLDTDTCVVSDITGIFDVLARFELALLHETRRGWDYRLEGVPDAFSEYNTGLLAFRKDEAVVRFFEQWRENFERLKSQLPVPNTDQPSFRKTLFDSDIRCATLPSEYHFIGDSTNYVMWDAKMIHARGDYDSIAGMVNSRLGGRVYIPNVGVFTGFQGRKQMLAQCGRFAWSALRLALRPPEDVTKKTPVKWW